MTKKRNGILVYALLLLAAFSFRAAVARLLPNDEPFDGKVYSQIARNVLEQHKYSHATEPPYEPSLIRLPGYPLFIAGIYSLFGYGDNTGVRLVQALLDTATCGLIAFLAFSWEPDQKLKRRSSIAALALAAICPFTTIYVTTILTETPTIFLTVAMCVTATLALRATRHSHSILLWLATGILSGMAVQFRPDSGLFALAIGITLVVSTLLRGGDVSLEKKRDEVLYRFSRASFLGALFSLAFCLVLVPWSIRNSRVFNVFQPLAPAHAEMPGEFVPHGYFAWLRTWVDDGRYVGPVFWAVDESPIKLEDIPDGAFDSAAEKQRVAALLEKYNNPKHLAPEPEAEEPPGSDEVDEGDDFDATTQLDDVTPGRDPGRDETKETDEEVDRESDNAGTSSEPAGPQPVEMTPEIDAGFATLAKERVQRNRLRSYLWLPMRRGVSLWFDTHSQYYPFEGMLLPVQNLDYSRQQQFWLPLFAGLTFLYTLLGIMGAGFLWQTRELISRQWLLLVGLLVFLRIGFFATLENPEPRYVVEVFPFLSVLGGIAITRILAELEAKAGKTRRARR